MLSLLEKIFGNVSFTSSHGRDFWHPWLDADEHSLGAHDRDDTEQPIYDDEYIQY